MPSLSCHASAFQPTMNAKLSQVCTVPLARDDTLDKNEGWMIQQHVIAGEVVCGSWKGKGKVLFRRGRS